MLVSECTVTQFECKCGSPRCIDGNMVKDGKNDCEGGSDEKPLDVCPGGKKARKSINSNKFQRPLNSKSFTQCKTNHGCRENLGEICMVGFLF